MPSKAEKAEKEQVLNALNTKIFCDLLDDFVMDVTLEAHAEVASSRAVCEICGTRCNAAHVPGSSSQSRKQPSTSRAGTPSLAEGKTTNGTNTPTNKGDGVAHLECVNCGRSISSNRYAPHLTSCMGLNSSRRGAARGSAKSKQPSDNGRSRSPASEAGYASDDVKSPPKGKSKSKRAEEAEFNLKRKRPISPQVSPIKKQKQKGSPASRLKSEADTLPMSSLSSTGSQSKIPSKLRDSSTAPFKDRSSSPSSRGSSPDASLSSTLSSSFKNKGAGNRVAPVALKRPSPPRPPPPVPAYIEDDDGDETGSSTDTDSS